MIKEKLNSFELALKSNIGGMKEKVSEDDQRKEQPMQQQQHKQQQEQDLQQQEQLQKQQHKSKETLRGTPGNKLLLTSLKQSGENKQIAVRDCW